jgi:hypothetical protein
MVTMFMAGCTSSSKPVKWPTRNEFIPKGAVKMTPATDLSPPVLHSAAWQTPVPMPAPISSAGAEDSPYMTPDGKTFYFVFVPDVSIPPEKQLAQGAAGTWYSTKVGNNWTSPQRAKLEKDPTTALDGCPTVRGNTLWFCSVRNGGYREIDLYTATIGDGKFTDVKNAGKRINKEVQVGEMDFSPDGNEIYFHNDKLGGKGKEDIFVTKNVNGAWQDAVPVDAINTADTDGWPFITQDGKELWFTRWYQGTPGVFRSIKNDTGWGSPELIISSFAGEPNLDAQGNIYFVHHYYKNGMMIEADIYVCYKI